MRCGRGKERESTSYWQKTLIGTFSFRGNDDISPTRPGEAEPIVDLMSDQDLQSLVPRGTKTWQRGDQESTIDLVLAPKELAATMLRCDIHGIDKTTHAYSCSFSCFGALARARPGRSM